MSLLDTGLLSLSLDNQTRVVDVKSAYFLDILPEKDFDQLTYLATNICKSPMAMITVTDTKNIFLKSQHGMDNLFVPTDVFEFCNATIQSDKDIFIINDISHFPTFENNSFVEKNKIVFYAGVKILNPEGKILGTLCLFDKKSRTLTSRQKNGLYSIAYKIYRIYKVRKFSRRMMDVQEELEERNEELKNFAGVVSHDMKMPLANMILTSDILKSKYGDVLDDQGKQYLDYLKQSALTLSDYISGILEHYESDKTASARKEVFDTQDLFEDVIDLLNINSNCDINVPNNIEMNANRIALQQILINLLTNSLKYNDKEYTQINVECEDLGEFYQFKIADNGPGIHQNDIKRIFELFATTSNHDRFGRKGNGIGLSTVKKLVKKLNGDIHVSSTLGEGTTFEFTIAK